MTAVKPISRAEYLLGRWLGLVLLDLLLLGIAGAGVYVFTFMVAAGPDQGRSDRMRLENEVLVARERVAPSHPDANYLSARFDEQLKRLRELNPDVWGDGTQPLNEKQRRQVELELLNQWHLVRAGEHQTFLFTGLEQARIDKRYLVLRYKPNMALAPPDQMARMVFRINGNFWPVSPVQLDSGASAFAVHQIAVPDKQVATLDIPYWMVDESGRLAIEIHNNHPENIVAGVERVRIHPHSMTFTPGKDIELFFRVEGFTPNFVRSMVILWVRLNFLAMLGLLAGSFLQFHVAALMASAIYLVAEGAAFINESLDLYQELNIIGEPFFDKIVISWQTFVDRINKEMYFSCFRILVRIVGHIFVFFVPSFGEYQPVLLFANGRIVPAEMVRGALLQIGVLWTGLCGLIAWLVFRRKELARVIV
jgi:ABC-type transport system involved in multi-copper enzyme maturation permease subunit